MDTQLHKQQKRLRCLSPRQLYVAEYLSEDGGGHLTYLAPTRVNLSIMEERWPDIRFRETREH